MKKIITIGLLLVFALAGCVGQNNEKQDDIDNKILRKQRILDFERPEKAPNISGLVKTIVGNEVTVLKIERQQKLDDENSENAEAKTDKDKQKETSGSVTGSRMGMGGGIGGGGGFNTGTIDDDRLAMLKSMSAGEEKIIIPVGIKMLKSEDGEMVEATLADVNKDKMLMIWTDQNITDKNIANFVIIK